MPPAGFAESVGCSDIGNRERVNRRERLARCCSTETTYDVVVLTGLQARDRGARGRLTGDPPADLDLLASRDRLRHGCDAVAGDGRRAGNGNRRRPVDLDAALPVGRHVDRCHARRATWAAPERTVRAAAQAGTAELAELCDRDALPVGGRVGRLPGQETLAATGRRDPRNRRVQEHVGRREGLARDLEARLVLAAVVRCERAGNRADVATPERGAGQLGVDDALLHVRRVHPRADVAHDREGVRTVDVVDARHVRVLRRDVGRCGAIGEGDAHDVTGPDVRRHVQVGTGTPAVATGVVDLERDIAFADDHPRPSPRRRYPGRVTSTTARPGRRGPENPFGREEVTVGEHDDVVREEPGPRQPRQRPPGSSSGVQRQRRSGGEGPVPAGTGDPAGRSSGKPLLQPL